MHPVVAHIASGWSFFSGTLLLLSSAFLYPRCKTRWQRRLCLLGTLVGGLLAGLSSTPLPVWFWFVGFGGVFVCFWPALKWRSGCRASLFLVWCGGLLFEASWQQTPTVALRNAAGIRPLVVIGDSVTAGLYESDVTWPQLLKERHRLQVADYSHVGDTAASALRRIHGRRIPDDAVVIVEIGGNDLLGSTVLPQFEEDLTELLSRVAGPGRTVLLFELPLPPLHSGWAAVQRRVCQQTGVQLVPRYQFVRILTSKRATVDSVHLSQDGHQAFCRFVESVLQMPNSEPGMVRQITSD